MRIGADWDRLQVTAIGAWRGMTGAGSNWTLHVHPYLPYLLNEILHLAPLGVKPLGAHIRGAII